MQTTPRLPLTRKLQEPPRITFRSGISGCCFDQRRVSRVMMANDLWAGFATGLVVGRRALLHAEGVRHGDDAAFASHAQPDLPRVAELCRRGREV